MNTQIKCPFCNKEFEPTDALRHQIEDEVSSSMEEKLRAKFEKEEGFELEALKKELREKEDKLSDFREKEIELREKSRKLEEREKDLEVEAQRRIDTEKLKVEEETSKRLGEQHRFESMEKDKRISDMKKIIEDLKRTSQQGSMQTQGEIGELELEDTLRRIFPTDEIIEVKKGELGGDVRQLVKTQRGTVCGVILWERKRTKAWDEKWVVKLKEDLRRDKAHIGVILTESFPKDFSKEIGERSGVWVVGLKLVEPLASLLRKNLYDVAKNQAVILNKQTKAEEIYDFVTSQEFNQQVARMVEIYLEMKGQITKERASSERAYKQREMQVDRLLKGVSGIYGSMQGIAGSALPTVNSLELEAGE
jgi:hypothetical protein